MRPPPRRANQPPARLSWCVSLALALAHRSRSDATHRAIDVTSERAVDAAIRDPRVFRVFRVFRVARVTLVRPGPRLTASSPPFLSSQTRHPEPRSRRSRVGGVGVLAGFAAVASACAVTLAARDAATGSNRGGSLGSTLALSSLGDVPDDAPFAPRTAVGGAGIYEPDWSEIDLGDDSFVVEDEDEDADGVADAGDVADAGTASISRDASVIGSNSAGGDVVASGNWRRRDANVANVASGLLREGVGDFIRGGHDDSYDEDTIPRDVAGGSGGSVLAQVPGFEGVEGFAEDRPDDAPERGRFGEPVAASLGARFDRDYGEPGDDDYEYDYDYRDYALLGARRDVGASGGASPGVPGFAEHVRAKSGSATRIVVSVKPGEWPLATLQLDSIRSWAPSLLPHVTVLTYDEDSRRACARRRPSVDCFLDESFADALVAGERGARGMSSLETRDALSWRKIHAAYSLVSAGTPVALVDADVVFLRDPSPEWRDGMSRFDVVVAGVVGDEADAQRAADTKITLLPATQKSRQLVRSWLRGETQPLGGVLPPGESPERGYFNYVLVPTAAKHFRIRAESAAVAANYVTATSGADGVFGDAAMVTGSFCDDGDAKARWLRGVTDQKIAGESALLAAPANREEEAAERAALGVAFQGKASRRERMAARKAARRVARRRDRAAKRAGGIPLISSVDGATHAATARVAGADPGEQNAGLGGFEGTVAGCDREKRRAYFAGKFRVGDDRHVDFEA